MYSHILIPVALDHEAVLPAKIATARRLLADGGRITLLTVLEDIPGFVAEFVTVSSENHLTAKIRGRLEEVASDDAAISCDVITGKPGVAIVQYASANGVDMIVMGSHRPGIEDYFLGSTAARVTRRAGCSVMVLRGDD